MTTQVKNFVLACETCKQSKAPNEVLRPPMGELVKSERAFQRLYVDLLGPYPRSTKGFVGVIVVLDHMSKFVFLEPIKKFTAAPIVDFIEKRVFHVFGVPEVVTSDNGVQFRSNIFKSFLETYGVKHNFTAVYSPQANASERVNRSVLAAIRSYVKPSQKDWDSKLSEINCALRSSFNSAIGASPFFTLFGHNMMLNGKSYGLLRSVNLLAEPDSDLRQSEKLELIRARVAKSLEQAYKQGAKAYNLRARPRQFEVDQTVFYRNFALSNAENHFSSKLAPKFLKAIVRKRVGNSYYELVSPEGKKLGTFHAKDIRT